VADHRVEVAHHHRIGVRAGDAANDVEGVGDVGHPVAHGFVQRILQGLRAALDRHHLGTQQLHAEHVGRLPLDVLRTHVHGAFHPEAGSDRRGRHAMLPCSRLRDHARLADLACKQCLAHGVVDLVRAGMVQVFTLQVDLRTAEVFGPAPGVVDRARAANVVLEFARQFCHELGVVPVLQVALVQFVERMHQRLGNEHATIRAEVATLVGQVIHLQGEPPQ